MKGRWLKALFALLIASGLWSGALAASENAQPLRMGEMLLIDSSGGSSEYAFTPPANGEYAVYLFPADEEPVTLDASLALEGEQIARAEAAGSGKRLFAGRLVAGADYRLTVSGSGRARLELARETLSRSFGMPLELEDGGSYSKLIARAGDVHWYSVKAQTSGAAILACAPEQRGLRMRMELFGADGRRIENSETLASGTALLSAQFEAGETLSVRVSGSGEGKYTLSCLRSENGARAQSVRLSTEQLTVDGYATGQLQARTQPEAACDLVYLDSSAPDVALVWPSGYVEGRHAGSAVVTAYAYGGARTSCRVTVEEVPLQGVAFSAEKLTLTEGDSRSLIAAVTPTNATERRLVYASGDESVVTVDKNGVITAVNPGTATVTVTSESGVFSDSAAVTVREAPPKYRALLIGEQDYAPSVETVRDGSEKSVRSLQSLLNAVSFDGGGSYSVSTLMDATRDEALQAVRRTFADARAADTSLVYITCHGFYQAGMTFFLMVDGSVLSASDLERELRQIPGEIVLLVDCCGSGGLIGEAGSAQDLMEGVISVFQGAVGAPSVHGSKYRVIASAHLDQDSYRIGFGESGMSTVFARALCDAAGWNMDRNAPSALNADVDYDGRITLAELEDYLTKRVMWYLNLAGGYVQNVSVYPKEDPKVVFGRTSE